MLTISRMRWLVVLVCGLLAAAALIGLLPPTEGPAVTATAIDGREVTLYGRGPYANHSILRATSYMGADLAILTTVVPLLLICAACLKRHPRSLLLASGGLMLALYYSISLAFGAAFNRYFLLYTVLFSVTGFTFGYSVHLSGHTSWKPVKHPRRKYWVTAVFMLVAGASALIWLSMILPALPSGDFSEFIDINTTEPTFVLDIGVIFPLFTICAISLLKHKEFGYRFTPILLTFYTLVGLLVAVQTLVQQSHGIEIPLPQMIGLVASFITLGAVALVLNVLFMKRIQA